MPPPGPQGDPGNPGLDAPQWFAGLVVPDDANGADGDFYIFIGAGPVGGGAGAWAFYTKVAGAWTILGSWNSAP